MTTAKKAFSARIEKDPSVPKQRYNSMIQRAKGLLEIAAGMYDTSLSFQTTRAPSKYCRLNRASAMTSILV